MSLGVPFQVGPYRGSQAPSFHYISGPATAALSTPHAFAKANNSIHHFLPFKFY